MNRITRTTAAAVLAAAVALGGAAPAALATPRAAHNKVDHRSAKAHEHVRAHKLTKAERRLATDQRWFARQVTVKVRQLQQVERFRPLKGLDQDVRDAVVANITDDVSELKAIRTDGLDGTRRELRSLRAELHKVHPNVYRNIVSDLAWADRLDARLAAATDPALAAQATVAQQRLADAVSLLLTYDGDTTAKQLVTARRALSSVSATVQSVSQKTPSTGDGTGTTD